MQEKQRAFLVRTAYWAVWAVLLWLVYNVLGNVSFIVIQRYNRPRLQKLAISCWTFWPGVWLCWFCWPWPWRRRWSR